MKLRYIDTLDAVIAVLVLGVVCAMALLAFAMPPAYGAEYEIFAERSGAAMRTDEPNVRRFRDKNAEPFDSLDTCRQVAAAEAIGRELGAGWRLQCRPVDVPPARVVVR